ncbi:MAG: CotH kinase family protein, partial [Alkalispirochaeta sp.]
MNRGAVFSLVAAVLLATLGGCSPTESGRESRSDGIVRIDFDEYRGTRESLPEGMFVTGEDGDGVPVDGDFYPFTGVSSVAREDEFAGFGAFTPAEDEFSFGIREHGDSDLRDSRLFLEYENRTERTIYGLRVRYDVETWLAGERDNRIRLKYHTATEGFGSIGDIVSTSNPVALGPDGPEPGTVLDGSQPEHRTTVELSFHFAQLEGMAAGGVDQFAPLEPGERGYLRWQYSNDQLTEGSLRSALALNNVEVEPLFEPAGTQAPVSFHRPPGFYDEPFDLELSSSLPDARIYYTTDGSQPDPEYVMSDAEWDALPRATRRRTFAYTRPLNLEALAERENDIALIPTTAREDEIGWTPPAFEVPKAATVRAIARGPHSRSAVRTATYFVPNHGMDHHELPVWSIQTERENFFDPDRGIYVPGPDAPRVNYFRRGREWEPVVHAEFFERDTSRVISQPLGVRVHGNYTRTFPQKSLRLYSRTDYGPGRMRHQFFESRDLDDYNRLLLRNGGNDWLGGMLSDPTLQALVEHLPIDTQHYRPTVVYLNGEYWGLHNMRDRQDQHYLETVYGIPRDEVVIVEIEGLVDTGQWDEEGEVYEPYVKFRERVSSGEIAGWDALNEEMALSEYLDYLFAQLYAGNYDWPQNNIRYWRYTGPEQTEAEGPRDGRWRWLLYDVDFAFGHQLSTTFDMVEWTFAYTEEHPFLQEGRREDEQDRFELNHRLLDSDTVRWELLQRLAVHLSTTAREERAERLVDRHVAAIESEMPRQIDRWGSPSS